MNLLNSQNGIHELLAKLEGALQLEDQAKPTDLLICGGSALIIRGYVERATQDVDVLALVEGGKDVSAEPLPAYLLRAIARVGRDFSLPEEWLNAGPAAMQEWGLPEGCVERADSYIYGSLLTTRFVGRFDQIHFKLYAAVDQGPGKHLQDLLALEPTEEELLVAARWSRQHDPSEGFALVLEQLLSYLGVSDVT